MTDYRDLASNSLPHEQVLKLSQTENFFELPYESNAPKKHSKFIDKILGYRIPKTEQRLLNKYQAYYKEGDDGSRKRSYQGTQAWIGLDPQVLQTPYTQIFNILNIIRPYKPKRIIDFGTGYGRMGIVMAAMMKEVEFMGYEIVKQRIAEAKRVYKYLNLNEDSLIEENILDNDFSIPKADVYFIYDFSDPPDIKQILDQLVNRAFDEKFMVVAKGEGVRSLIQLRYPELWCAHKPIQNKEWSLYWTAPFPMI